jgi:hypothetical protein
VSIVTAPLADWDRDRKLRKAVWIGLALVFAVGAVMYAKKASDERSAIIRWLYQVKQLQQGENIWDRYMFPNPPIFPLTLYPLTWMPTLPAAMVWYAFKVGLAFAAIAMCFRMSRRDDDARPIPGIIQLLVIALSLRPILSDLHHANNNLLILFLVVAALYAWRRSYDVLAGLALALAITYKVTPALFVVYFAYRGNWRVVGSTILGIGLFLLVVPSLFLGPSFNGECLAMWWHRMLRPFVVSDVVGFREINQSMAGVLMRLLTESPPGEARYNPRDGLNLLSVEPRYVVWAIKGISVGMLGVLAWICRTPASRRDDPRWLGEFSLIVLAMLMISERSWKHHFVTLLLPFTFLAVRLWTNEIPRRVRWPVAIGLGLAGTLMLTTSSEVGGFFVEGEGHKLALYYGMFFWAALVLFLATAWRVVAERGADPFAVPSPVNTPPTPAIPAPHRPRDGERTTAEEPPTNRRIS